MVVSPMTTSGSGFYFETKVQAFFTCLLLARARTPLHHDAEIEEIQLQNQRRGYATDDMLIVLKRSDNDKVRLVCQIKASLAISKTSAPFKEAIEDAWQDFNNSNVFDKEKDCILLIIGYGTENTRDLARLFESARHVGPMEWNSFKRSVQEQKKIKIIKEILSDKDDISLHSFLKKLYVLHIDIELPLSTVEWLVYSFISQFDRDDPNGIFCKILDFVKQRNRVGGVINKGTIPSDIQEIFEFEEAEEIDGNFITSASKDSYWVADIGDLVTANLVGSWEETNADKKIIEMLSGKNYAEWQRNITSVNDLPIIYKQRKIIGYHNSGWEVDDRKSFWKSLSDKMTNDDLMKFKDISVKILSERDPKFNLPSEERYMADLKGEILQHSNRLRDGVTETLVLLNVYSDELVNCDEYTRKNTPYITVKSIFDNANCTLWASLDRLLPALAEASPEAFLDAVKNSLKKDPCPFVKIFSMESTGIFGSNYMTGLLWALETLAWSGKYLLDVCDILIGLAKIDPGGNWGNRPVNSLSDIFTSWKPQTTANVEERKQILGKIRKENPDIAWKLLLTLLPNQKNVLNPNRKPKWLELVPEDFKETPTKAEFNEQLLYCLDLAVSIAKDDVERLKELLLYSYSLPSSYFEEILDHMASDEILSLPESDKIPLKEKLIEILNRDISSNREHRVFSGETAKKMQEVIDNLVSEDILYKYQFLFNLDDLSLQKSSDYQQEQKRIEIERKNAIKEIFDSKGLECVIKFAESIKFKWEAGYALGEIGNDQIDNKIIPKLLSHENQEMQDFVGSYIWQRYSTKRSRWVDKFEIRKWSKNEKLQFLLRLPQELETWEIVTSILREEENCYWESINRIWPRNDDDVHFAINKLIKYKQYYKALHCLYRIARSDNGKEEFNAILAIKILLNLRIPSKNLSATDRHQIVEIFKMLQEELPDNKDDILKLEFLYLPLLTSSYDGSARPLALEKELSEHPSLYCSIIQKIYLPKEAQEKLKETNGKIEATQEEMQIAQKGFDLLFHWKIVPGTLDNGDFDKQKFETWVNDMIKICQKSDHLEMALLKFGEVLVHAPSDPDGLWIDHTVAKLLDRSDMDVLRESFYIAMRNERGSYWVDPEAKEELELCDKYERWAEELKEYGYLRLSQTMKDLAGSYKIEAENRRKELP